MSVVLWGLGASLGFPLTISAASDTGPDAPTRVSVVATTGYLAFLVGPPLLGYLGEHYGLRSAMLIFTVGIEISKHAWLNGGNGLFNLFNLVNGILWLLLMVIFLKDKQMGNSHEG